MPTNFAPPVNVSPLIRFGRYSMLLVGIAYGAFWQSRYTKKELALKDIKAKEKAARDARLAQERELRNAAQVGNKDNFVYLDKLDTIDIEIPSSPFPVDNNNVKPYNDLLQNDIPDLEVKKATRTVKVSDSQDVSLQKNDVPVLIGEEAEKNANQLSQSETNSNIKDIFPDIIMRD